MIQIALAGLTLAVLAWLYMRDNSAEVPPILQILVVLGSLVLVKKVGERGMQRAALKTNVSYLDDLALDSWAMPGEGSGDDKQVERFMPPSLVCSQNAPLPPLQYLGGMDARVPTLRRLAVVPALLSGTELESVKSSCQSVPWTTGRHRRYPTNDVQLNCLPW